MDTNDFNDFPEVTEFEVFRAFDEMSPYKSVPDEIYPVLIKAGIEVLKNPLVNVFNQRLKIGYFPILWKKGKVVGVPNCGKTELTSVKSYKPITLLSVIG